MTEKIKQRCSQMTDIDDKELAVASIAIFLIVAGIFFKTGGYLSGLATRHVPIISIDGIIKFAAIIIAEIIIVSLLFSIMLIFACTAKWMVSSDCT